MLGPSLQGSGGDFNVPAVWKTFLVTLSSALKRRVPVRVETGSEKRWGRVQPPHLYGETKTQRRPLEKSLPVPGLSGYIWAMGLRL